MKAYDRLISDPCGAALCNPPYSGGSSGYLTRINASIQPSFFTSGGTTGADTTGSFCYQFQPSAFPYVLFGGSDITSVTPVFGNVALNGTFIGNTAIKQFRPVAACVRWVPTGPLAKRAGMVSLGYNAGALVSNASGATPANILSVAQDCLERVPNGGSEHEIRWLPTTVDELYTSPGNGISSPFAGAGTLLVDGVGIDGSYTSPTTVVLNGYLELTIVIEWLPSAGQGISVTPEPSPGFTTQQYQSTLGDVGAFLLHGVRRAGSAFAAGAAAKVVQTLGSYSSTRRFTSGLPLILN